MSNEHFNRLTPAQIAKVVKDLRTKSAVGPGNMIVHTVMAEAADLIESQAAELAKTQAGWDDQKARHKECWLALYRNSIRALDAEAELARVKAARCQP